MKQNLNGLALIAVAVMSILLLTTCGDSPTMPTAESSDYDIYFRDINFEKIYAFNTAKMALVDSFTLPYEGVIPQVSADGRFMILSNLVTTVVDIDSKELITQLNIHSNVVTVSPDGKYLAVQGDSLNIVDASSFATVFTDSIYPNYGHFSIDGKYYYCTMVNSQLIYRLNLDVIPFQADFINYPGHYPGPLVASKDNSHLYLITNSFRAHFEIYNIDHDSIEFDFQLQTPVADITITPDGKYVIYDEGENVVNFEDPPSPRTISVYDIMARQMKTIIPTFGVLPDNMDGSPAGYMVVTPDSRWLAAGGYGLILVDLVNMKISNILTLENTAVQYVSCRQIKK